MNFRRFVSVIAAALSIGVCAFITFISRDTDMNTIIYNAVFLGLMLIMLFAAYVAGMRRLIGISSALKKAASKVSAGTFKEDAELRSDEVLFGNRFLDGALLQYLQMTRNHPDASCDVQNFINEDMIESHVHRGLLELVPDILTSLGILGTFLGLVMGLRGFDPSSYEQMAGSITPLINGIKIAFITSIYGISLSLSFSYHLRSEFSNLTACLEEFLDSYYLHVHPPYEVDSLQKLLANQKTREEMAENLTNVFIDNMGKCFESTINPAYERMTEGISQVVESFTASQTKVMEQVCTAVARQMQEEMKANFQQLGNMVTQMQKSQSSYMEFMDRSMDRMQHSFTLMQDNMNRMTEYHNGTIAALDVAQKDSLKLNEEQQKVYQDYIRFMYHTINEFSEVWERNSEKLQLYTDEIAKMGPVRSNLEIRQDLERISSNLMDMRQRQLHIDRTLEASATDTEAINLMDEALRKLDQLNKKVDEVQNPPTFFRSLRKNK